MASTIGIILFVLAWSGGHALLPNSLVTVVDNGYVDVVVALHEKVNEADEIIDSIRVSVPILLLFT